jgi:tetratricopeptide (TPR) repeat protein
MTVPVPVPPRVMRRLSFAACSLVVAAIMSIVSACGARSVRPVTTGPVYPQYEFPAVPEALATQAGAAAILHKEAWDLLQAGSARAANRRFETALRRAPDFYPSVTGLGYTALVQNEYKEAIEEFDKALAAAPDYIPALLGRAEALVATNDTAAAVAALDAVLKVDPSRAELKTRADALRFRSIEDLVAQARTAQQGGRLDEARTAYEQALQASPESAFLHRELASTERQAGQLDRAAEHAQKARGLDDKDASTYLLIGDIENARGNLSAAIEAWRRAKELGAPADLTANINDAERRLAFAAMPEAFRSIPAAPRVTRADLAALVGARLENWIAQVPPTSPGLITDVREHWAQRWILAVTRAGLMEVYPNHTFQPGDVVQRGDLAWVISRALTIAAARRSTPSPSWMEEKPVFPDLPPAHASYPAAALAVAAGVLATGPENVFQPSRPVSGAEAVAAVDRLEEMVARQ